MAMNARRRYGVGHLRRVADQLVRAERREVRVPGGSGQPQGFEMLQRCYQQPDRATILAVVLGGAELREAQA